MEEFQTPILPPGKNWKIVQTVKMIFTSAMAQDSLADSQDRHSLLKNENTARDYVCVYGGGIYASHVFSEHISVHTVAVF